MAFIRQCDGLGSQTPCCQLLNQLVLPLETSLIRDRSYYRASALISVGGLPIWSYNILPRASFFPT